MGNLYKHPVTSFNGILLHFQRNYKEHYPTKKGFTFINSLMKEFLTQQGCVPSVKNTHYKLDKNAQKVQKRWKEWLKYLEDKYER